METEACTGTAPAGCPSRAPAEAAGRTAVGAAAPGCRVAHAEQAGAHDKELLLVQPAERAGQCAAAAGRQHDGCGVRLAAAASGGGRQRRQAATLRCAHWRQRATQLCGLSYQQRRQQQQALAGKSRPAAAASEPLLQGWRPGLHTPAAYLLQSIAVLSTGPAIVAALTCKQRRGHLRRSCDVGCARAIHRTLPQRREQQMRVPLPNAHMECRRGAPDG